MRTEALNGTISLLFTDIEGSSELIERLGDRRWAAALELHDLTIRNQVEAHLGLIIKAVGDGFMVAFSSARRALNCAIAIQRALDEEDWSADPGLRVRIGIHTGEAVERDGDVFGKHVVIASRIGASAIGGEILVSSLVRELAASEGDFHFGPGRELALKGLSGRHRVFSVIWRLAEIVQEGDGSDVPSGVPPGGAGRAARTANTRLPPLLRRTERRPLVGRVAELVRLHAIWAEVQGGEHRFAVLAGEPGIGKTRLMTEFARTLHAQGANVLVGRCDEKKLVPYQPLVEALTTYVRTCPESVLRGQLGPSGGELLRLVPELSGALPDVPLPLAEEPEGQRYRLFEAVATLLRNVSASRHTVLAIDDLHWADASTLLLLRHIARSSETLRVLVLGTYRVTDLGAAEQLAETLADLSREEALDRVVLSGLDRASVTSLIAAVAGHEPPPDFARVVHEETAGNPLFVSQVLHHLMETGEVPRGGGKWRDGSSVLQIPEAARDVISQRLGRLGEHACVVLRAAAVVGREFELAVLEQVCDLSGEELIDALDAASRARLIEEVDDRPGRYRFAHALVRESLYSELTSARRSRLHRTVGNAFQHVYSTVPERHLAELAHHFVRAGAVGDLDKALDFSLRAAEQANTLLAYEQAAAHYKQALEINEQLGRSASIRGELLLQLGETHGRAGALQSAREYLGAAQDLADAIAAPELGARAALACGASWWQTGFDDRELAGRLARALAELPQQDSELRAQVMARLSAELCDGDVLTQREALSRAAVSMARRIGAPAPLAAGLFARHYALLNTDRIEERLAISAEAVRVGQQSLGAEMVVQARLRRFHDLVEIGDLSGALEEHAAFARVSNEVKQPFFRFLTAQQRATLNLWRGRHADFEQSLGECAGFAQEVEHEALMMHALGGLGGVYMLTKGQWMQALQLAEGVVDGEGLGANPDWLWRASVALLHAELGHERETRIHFERAAGANFAVVDDGSRTCALSVLVRPCEVLADVDRGTVLYHELRTHQGRWIVPHYGGPPLGPADMFLGMLAKLIGRWGEAEEHFAVALRLAEKISSPSWTARVQYETAVMLLTRCADGDEQRAGSMLAEARRPADSLGMSGLEIKIDAALAPARAPK